MNNFNSNFKFDTSRYIYFCYQIYLDREKSEWQKERSDQDSVSQIYAHRIQVTLLNIDKQGERQVREQEKCKRARETQERRVTKRESDKASLM